jgi:toluene monooxygenase electron transfer component
MKISVETKWDEYTFPCSPDESLLGAGLAAGVALPYECATGTCGTCHARVMSGSVEPGWLAAPGYAKLRPQEGDVLMCQAHPRSDCHLRIKSKITQPQAAAPIEFNRLGRIDLVRKLTNDVVHFEVELSSPMTFEAGQFVTVQAPGLDGRRAYSMVNFGRDLDRLSFVVKRKPGGSFSDWLFNAEVSGCELGIMGPLGRATFRPDEQRDIVCIAGGSGIAGMMSMLEHATQISYFHHHRGHVFFGVRTLLDAFYLEELAHYVESGKGGLGVTVAISHEQSRGASHPTFSDIRVAEGMVHEVAAASMAGKWDNVVGFVAGPQPMVDAGLRVLIADAGLQREFIRYDKF